MGELKILYLNSFFFLIKKNVIVINTFKLVFADLFVFADFIYFLLEIIKKRFSKLLYNIWRTGFTVFTQKTKT